MNTPMVDYPEEQSAVFAGCTVEHLYDAAKERTAQRPEKGMFNVFGDKPDTEENFTAILLLSGKGANEAVKAAYEVFEEINRQ